MKQAEIIDELRFHAEMVAGHEEGYTPEFAVHGIYFGEGDPEQGGQHWNFTRSLGEDDDGVCTVKEIQEVTIYGGIINFTLTRQSLACEFDEDAAHSTMTRRLFITYEIDDETWNSLVKQAKLIFEGESYFKLVL
ncbi:MAG TPA: hypothetical protein VFZ34_21465 [Blastocatellia bacterium]|nr:hypothetical protein [Blastocatellia bacterium]